MARAHRGRHARTGAAWGAPVEATLAILEIVASEQPELLEFQAQALLNSTMSFALRDLAATFDVAPEDVGDAACRACTHLDRLERHRRTWRDPAELLDSPNLSALVSVSRARIRRTSPPARRQKLERIQRRVEAAYKLARTRAWVDAFIGPLPAKARKVQSDVR